MNQTSTEFTKGVIPKRNIKKAETKAPKQLKSDKNRIIHAVDIHGYNG